MDTENISKQLNKINEKINDMNSSGKAISADAVELIEAQLKNVYQTLEIFEKQKAKENLAAVAEETIPVDIKEVVGISLENAATVIAEEIIPAESVSVVEKTTKTANAEKQDNSLAGKMKRKPIKDLTTAIGINEKFGFIQYFGNDSEAWSNALNKLNSSSLQEAENLLEEFAKKYKWKEDDELLQTLTDLVQRRYL